MIGTGCLLCSIKHKGQGQGALSPGDCGCPVLGLLESSRKVEKHRRDDSSVMETWREVGEGRGLLLPTILPVLGVQLQPP